MSRVILLDSGPLGLLANPNPRARAARCVASAIRLRRLGVTILIPALADFEVRRSLKLAGEFSSAQTLDTLIATYGYLTPTPRAVEFAADLWADVRRQGQAVGPDLDLHADVALAGQALELEAEGYDAWIATDNLRHLRRLFARAELWETLGPSGPAILNP